jgi:EAL domain-containing protein (putative c-di-GMP-specific phosphodiesterase class I)/CHASE2 domain-containing sensor protein
MPWITGLCLLIGLLDAGAPLETMLRTMRDTMRQHDASGRVMVVGIDERTVGRLAEWPLPRRHYAALIDRLNRLGARRIFMDVSFATPSTPAEDGALADAIARSHAEVVLPAWFQQDSRSGRRIDILPMAALRPHAAIANISVAFDRGGVVRRLPYAMRIGDHVYPSFAAKLAGATGAAGESFPQDYSFRIAAIPVTSAIDLLDGRVAPGTLAGRDVLIGITSPQLDAAYFAPTVGRVSGVFLHALGAETLLAGRPVELPWFLPFPFLWAMMVAFRSLRHRPTARAIYGVTVATALGLPFLLESHMISVELVPSYMLLAMAGLWSLWARHRASYRDRAVVNVTTGLPNLNALRLLDGEPGHALVAARVRNFPEITASLAADDERALVHQIARRLAFGNNDATIYQGDEGIFAWTMPEGPMSDTSGHFDALQALFRNAVAIGDRHIDLAISFGVAMDGAPGCATTPFARLGGALTAADAAAVTGLHWKIHEPLGASDSNWNLSLLTRLDAAIDAGEIHVAYQPKIALCSGRIMGAEALVRWTHPEKGPISPGDFIPAAERQDRIGKLTYHVLESAIRVAATINRHGIGFGMAVNLSVRLLGDPDLEGNVTALLQRYGLAPHLLTLEITETAALSGNAGFVAVLETLRQRGIGLSIDDYGTGFSNLENLRQIPANEIKIDRSFVDAITHSRSDAVMVRSTIEMAHSLGRTVVAEGVERMETLNALRGMGCDLVQGYLTGRPMTFTALVRTLLRARQKKVA